MKKGKKRVLIVGIVIFIALAVFIYVKFYFVFGVGVKTGELNYVVEKGYVFKTFEGKLIQEGFQTEKNTGGIHSNEFIFSIEDRELAQKLMEGYEGKEMSLRYKEYLGVLPWRGYSKFIVDSIVSSRVIMDKRENLIPIVGGAQ